MGTAALEKPESLSKVCASDLQTGLQIFPKEKGGWQSERLIRR